PSEDQMPAGNTLFIGKTPPSIDATQAKPANGPTIQGWDDKHPLMRNLSALYEIGIDEAIKLPPLPPGARKLMEAERGQVLIAAIPRGPYADVVMAFPLITNDGNVNTRWPLLPSFVLFLRNTLFALGNVRDASVEEATIPGQEKILRPGGATEIKIRKPDGAIRTMERGPRPDFAFLETDQIGVYEVRWADQFRRFAVNLFPQQEHDESDLAVREEVKIGEKTISAGGTRKQPQDLWKLGVLLGFIVLLVEWWVYNKRVQV
ncbi:MAG: hypothetical protein ACRCZF_05895, partial [Gemmataceae bacterium]